MGRKAKQLSVNFAILCLSILISLLTIEMGFRIFSSKPSKNAGHHQLFCQYHPLLGWEKIPSSTGTHTTDEYSVLESFNSRGLRGPDYPYRKPTDEYRILVLGDSYTEGYMVEFDELFSEVLNEKLNQRRQDKSYGVINAGTGGYSTDQELLFFQNEGKKYNPDLTILMFCSNDVWYNNQPKYWRGYKPLFRLEDNRLILTNVPVPTPDPHTNLTQSVERETSPFQKIKMGLAQKSHAYKFAVDRIRNIPFLYAVAINLGVAKGPSIPEEFRVYQTSYNAVVHDAWKITEALIIKLKEETAAANSELLVFYIPNRASIYDEEWQATRGKYRMSSENWNINQVGIELEAICKKNNIDCINPTQLFRAEAIKLQKQKKRLYFLKDGHWNVLGNRFAGQVLFQYLERKLSHKIP